MNEIASKPASKRRKIYGFSVLIAIVVAVIVAVYANQGNDTRSDSPSTKASDGSAIWPRHKLGDISFDAPFQLSAGPDITAQLPEKTRAVLDHYEVFESDSTNPHVKISRVTYKPGVEINMDAELNGAVSALATEAGDKDPDFTLTTASVDGLPACRTSYTSHANGKPLRVDAIFIQNGQKMWQIQVISIGISVFDSERFINSIHTSK